MDINPNYSTKPLLIKIYLINNQLSEAKQILVDFGNAIKSFQEKCEKDDLRLMMMMLWCIYILAPNEQLSYLSRLWQGNKKTIRIARRLFELAEDLVQSPSGKLAMRVLYGKKIKREEARNDLNEILASGQEGDNAINQQQKIPPIKTDRVSLDRLSFLPSLKSLCFQTLWQSNVRQLPNDHKGQKVPWELREEYQSYRP